MAKGCEQMLTMPGEKAGEGSGTGVPGELDTESAPGGRVLQWAVSPLSPTLDAGLSEGLLSLSLEAAAATALFRKGRFVSSSDGPFYRRGSTGPGGPREEALPAGPPR